ncbi:MAG: sensor histidine kinase [Coriobacteriales bacterium]|jgi:signal transduction histidine kinase|nr:sensor histidine kinase [Coriobacteriales bacterium]
MRLTTYLKERSFFIVMSVCIVVLFTAVLAFNGVHPLAIGGSDLAVLIAVGLTIGVDFFRRRYFYDQLDMLLEELDRKHLISEIIDPPGFLEGDLTYEALQGVSRSANEEVARHWRMTEEYRDFIETWVHEIKTPIAAANLIIENNYNEVPTTLLPEISRIESYVEQALFYARGMNVERDYVIRSESLETLVKGSLRKHSRTLIESKVTPQLDDLEFTVYVDNKWFDFILGQLFSNAAKYRRRDGEPAFLRISAELLAPGSAEERVVLRIADNGVGVHPADVEHVFEKGFTGENSRGRGRSTGIGLYICKRLCEKTGLDIALESTLGEGTVVQVTFPRNKLHFVEAKDNSHERPARA